MWTAWKIAKVLKIKRERRRVRRGRKTTTQQGAIRSRERNGVELGIKN